MRCHGCGDEVEENEESNYCDGCYHDRMKESE